MLKRYFMVLTMLFALPAFANAWTLNAKTAKTGQGTISPAGNATYGVGVDSAEYTVTPLTGFTVAKVTLDGVTLAAVNGTYVAPAPPVLTKYRYMVAYFAANTYSITTTVTPGGAVREDNFESLTKIPAGASRQIQVIPNVGYSAAVTASVGGVVTDYVAANGAACKLVTFTSLAANHTVDAVFTVAPVVTANAGQDVATTGNAADKTGKLFGSATSTPVAALTYAWTCTAAPAGGATADLEFGTAGAAVTTVWSTKPGVYTATLTVNGTATDTATVTVIDSIIIGNAMCTSCHAGKSDDVIANYQASLHKTNPYHVVGCQDCHTADAHTTLPAANVCVSCHTGAYVVHAGLYTDNCIDCHNPHTLNIPPPAKSVANAHAVTGVIAVTGAAVAVVNTNDLEITFNVKADGVNNADFTTLYSVRRFTAAGVAYDPITGGILDLTDAANGNYKLTITNGAVTYAADGRISVRLQNAAGVRAIATVNYPLNPKVDLVSNQACVNCHGANGVNIHNANPMGVTNCTVCHDPRVLAQRVAPMIHGIHNSHNMPAGYTFKPGVVFTDVTFPTYMNNCSVCHDSDAALAVINAKPVSYDYCMTCHGDFTSFDHGNTMFDTTEHAAFNSATNCVGCHVGATHTTFHNGRLTERSGLLMNGKDVSVVEGAKVAMTITGVKRLLPASGKTEDRLQVTWTASYNGTQVNPCNATAAAGLPVFAHGGKIDLVAVPPSNPVKGALGQVSGNLSLLRAFGQGDDWVNAGILSAPVAQDNTAGNMKLPVIPAASPGQPIATNLDTTNTVCASNIATTTITLTPTEHASTATKGIVALQGKAQVKLPYTFDNPLTTTVEAKDIIQVRSKTPTREFTLVPAVTADTVLAVPAQLRRNIVDTASCLGCHVGSLYQHGGNRIDNVDMCVTCHNEASSEQNARVFDGVSATEAYDGKDGQTYGFKSLLHAVHSAGHTGAQTMVYRTMGNYVWGGHGAVVPNYPALDVFADGLGYDVNRNITFDDSAALTQTVGTGSAAKIFGSSAPHGTGAPTGDTGPSAAYVDATTKNIVASNPSAPYNTVYRAHNFHAPTYPQALNNCAGCHKPNTFGFPDATKAVATTVNVGSVAPDQTAAPHANYGNQLDDVLQGPAAAACMSCHATSNTDKTLGKTKAWFSNHANGGGFAPAAFNNGRTSVLEGTVIENCASCHTN